MRTSKHLKFLQLMDVIVWLRESLTTPKSLTFCESFTRISNSLKGKNISKYIHLSVSCPVSKAFRLLRRCVDENPYVPIYQVSKEKTKSLGIDYIPLKDSIKETVESLKDKGFIHF